MRTHVLSLFGHILAAATWALLAGSWAYAADEQQGLGAGNAVIAVQLTVLHVASAYLRRH